MTHRRILAVSLVGLSFPCALWACSDDDVPITVPSDDAAIEAAADVALDTATLPDVRADAPEAGADALPDAPLLRGGQVDRLGRAAIIEALIPALDRDGYNRADPFTLAGAGALNVVALNADFQYGLVRLDLLDGIDNWDGGSRDGSTIQVPIDAGPDADGGTSAVYVFSHPLVNMLRNDLLVVDSSRPFSPTGYLEIEYNSFVLNTPGAHTTCGGRWIGDDSVDKLMSLLVTKTLAGVSDGVSAPAKAPSTTFPYLAPP